MSILKIQVLLLIGCSVCLAQEDAKSEFDSKESKAERLSYASDHANALVGSSSKSKVLPLDEPLLRWTNPYSNVKDGFLFGWVDEKGIPMAVAQIYLIPNSETAWGIETQSLSQDSFKLASETNGPWRPRKPGVTWNAFPEKAAAVKPANSKPLRLTQMRSLARRFRGDDEFADEGNTLRLLTNPLLRYEDSSTGVLDGTLFTLVHGTDPEMIILIELREDKTTKQAAYYYALAPMTSYELRCQLDGKEVWHKPRMNSNQTTDIFWQRGLSDSKRGGFFRLFGF